MKTPQSKAARKDAGGRDPAAIGGSLLGLGEGRWRERLPPIFLLCLLVDSSDEYCWRPFPKGNLTFILDFGNFHDVLQPLTMIRQPTIAV